MCCFWHFFEKFEEQYEGQCGQVSREGVVQVKAMDRKHRKYTKKPSKKNISETIKGPKKTMTTRPKKGQSIRGGGINKLK